MEKATCQKCFHYEACKAIDLSGCFDAPEVENGPCEYYVDADRVKIQDQANWREQVTQYRDGDVHVTYRCTKCNNLRKVKSYNKTEWEEYYSEHYRDNLELPGFCEICGSVINGLVDNEQH